MGEAVMKLNEATQEEKDKLAIYELEQGYKKRILNNGQIQYEFNKDIANEEGVLLLKKGNKLNKEQFNRILQQVVKHKLEEPIESYLTIAGQLETESLLHELISIGKNLFESKKHDFSVTTKIITNAINKINFDNITLNRLTVLQKTDPLKFNYSLGCALIATKIGLELGYNKNMQEDIFAAGLLHDTGQLYIDPTIQNKKGKELTEQDLRAIKVHPLVSHMILDVNCFSANTLDAILQHHENLDGSGYPKKLQWSQIGEYARIINAVGSFVAMQHQGRKSLEQTLRILEIHSRKISISGEPISPIYDSKIVNVLSSLKIPINKDKQPKRDLVKEAELIPHLVKTYQDINEHSLSFQSTLESGKMRYHQISESLDNISQMLYKMRQLTIVSTGMSDTESLQLSTDYEFIQAYLNDVEAVNAELKRYRGRIGDSIRALNQRYNISEVRNFTNANFMTLTEQIDKLDEI